MKPRAPSLKLYSKAPRRYPEAALQRAICQWLIIAGVPGLLWFHVPNGMVSNARTVAHMKRIGMRPGVADLVVIMPGGKTHCLELKAKNGKLSRDQIVFSADCAIAGVPYKVCDNIDDALRVLRSWKAIEADMAGKWGHVTKRRQELRGWQEAAG